LEREYTRERIVGSNPMFSAIAPKHISFLDKFPLTQP
jgi:hypothetical protein